MRRPTTKTPFAYFHTATRHRGRPVHRIYAATPRPDMHATVSYFHTPNGRQGFAVLFTNGASNVQFQTGAGLYNTWKASAEPGRFWNSHIREQPVFHLADWNEADTTGRGGHIPAAAGPIPWLVLDHFNTY